MITADTFEIDRVFHTKKPKWVVNQYRGVFRMMCYGPFRTKRCAVSIQKDLERVHTAIAYLTVGFPNGRK